MQCWRWHFLRHSHQRRRYLASCCTHRSTWASALLQAAPRSLIMLQERRKEMAKTVSKLSEDGKVAIRNVRRDSIKQVRLNVA